MITDVPVAITTTTIHIYSIKPAASNENTKSIIPTDKDTHTLTPWSLLPGSFIGISIWQLDDSDLTGLKLDDNDFVEMKLDDRMNESVGLRSCGVIAMMGGLALKLVSTVSGIAVKVG